VARCLRGSYGSIVLRAITTAGRCRSMWRAADEGENRMNNDDKPVVHEPWDNDMRTIVNLIAMAIICLTIFLIFAAIGPTKADALLLINTGPARAM
jgi:hypothetical protein